MATAGNSRTYVSTHYPQTMAGFGTGYQYGVLVKANWDLRVWKRKIGATWTRSGTTVTVTTTSHGFSVGQALDVFGCSCPEAFPNSSYTVATVPSANTYTLTGINAGTTSGYADIYQSYDITTGSTAGIAMGLPINSSDDHYAVCLGVDSQDRVWLTGNVHDGPFRCVRSTTGGSITAWTTVTATSFSSGTGAGLDAAASSGTGAYTYSTFVRRTDGVLCWFMSQSEAPGNSHGRDWLAYYLPATSTTTWLKMIDNSSSTGRGEFAQTDPYGILSADRVYICGVTIENRNGTDRTHVTGIWRTNDTDSTSQQRPWYIYSDAAPGGTTCRDSWRSASGQVQTMPIRWENMAAGTEMTSAPTYSSHYGQGVGIDANGRPHALFNINSTSDWVELYWNGLGWSSRPVTGPGNGDPTILSVNGKRLYTLATSGTYRTRIRSLDSNQWFVMGDLMPYGAEPNPDPARLLDGWVDLQLSDGDTPRVFSFGRHARANAA